MTELLDTKVCKHCKTEKPLSEFGKDKRNPDGLNVECRECQRQLVVAKTDADRQAEKRYREKQKEKGCKVPILRTNRSGLAFSIGR